MKFIATLLRKLSPFLILAVGICGYYYLVITTPEAVRRDPPEPIIDVETATLQKQDFTVVLRSQGTVSARTESTLIPEVSGKIISVSPNFREGGFFSKGDVLLEIDPSDYRTALTIAEANLADARVRLAEEEEQSKQAQIDWERLGAGERPTDLVLRVPQLARARSNVMAAEARVNEARRNLERTRISVPYDGRVLTQDVDIGQVVGQNTRLARVYAVDYAEIRLPLTTAEYAFLDIKPVVRRETRAQDNLPVKLSADFGKERHTWKGRIVRVEGAIDTTSRQIFVVGQVDDPYGPAHNEPLKVGLFVEAEIEGSVLKDVYVLPRTALREAHYIMTLDDEYRILRVPVDPIWADEDVIVFRKDSLPEGTLVSVTQIALAIDGLKVWPAGVPKPEREGGRGGRGGPGGQGGGGQGGGPRGGG